MAIGRINATLTGVQPGGLAKIVPTSVAVGSGSGSVDANGNVTFSGASSVSLNGCFSSTYDNYKVILNSSASSNQVLQMRLRNTSDDTTNDNYSLGYEVANYGNSTKNLGPQTFMDIGPHWIYQNFTVFDIANPMLAKDKMVNCHGFGISGSGGNRVFLTSSALKNNSNTFTGFTLFATTGTISGTVRVYGYTQ